MTKIMFFYLRISKTFIYFKIIHYIKIFKKYFLNFKSLARFLYYVKRRKTRVEAELFRIILNSKISKVWHGFCTMLNVARQE